MWKVVILFGDFDVVFLSEGLLLFLLIVILFRVRYFFFLNFIVVL